MSNNTEVKLKTIADMEDEKVKFFIDAYQRGYRWTESEVRDPKGVRLRRAKIVRDSTASSQLLLPKRRTVSHGKLSMDNKD